MAARTRHHKFRILSWVGGGALLLAAALVPAGQAQGRVVTPGHAGHLAAWNSGRAGGSSQARAANPVRHVVVIYLENHSFDSVLGFWCDNHPSRCPKGGMPAKVKLSNGAVIKPSVDPDKVPYVLHTVASQVAAINGGKMNGWEKIPKGTCDAATHYQCVSGYKPRQVPNLTSLAQKFAISDDTFSMTDSESWAGHIDIAAAQQERFLGNNPPSHPWPPPKGWGCDSGGTTPWVTRQHTIKMIPSCVPDPSLNPTKYPFGGAFEKTPAYFIPTIMDRLHAAGRSWRIYGASTKSSLGYGLWNICSSFAQCLDTRQHKRLVPDAQFITDAHQGKLPAFSVVTPGGAKFLSACHNDMSMTACDNWVGQLAKAIMNGPEWSSTAAFITFDDCGCFYDQVPPPLNPGGRREGPRVPLIILSPYARPHFTDSRVTTFAGILSYTEHLFGLTPLGVNDAKAYDFKNAFNYSQTPLKPIHMVNRPLPAWAKHLRVTKAMANDPT